MSDYVLPPDLVPAEIEWRLIDAVAVYSSPLNGAVRTYARPGNRWGARLTFRALSGADRRRLMALVSILRGRANRLWVTDASSDAGGTLATPELITNNAAVAGTTGWSSSNAELALSADTHQGLRLTRTGVTGDRYAYQAAATTVSGAPYALRFLLAAGKGALRLSGCAGTSQGGTGLVNGTARTAGGRYVETFTASGSSTHLSFHDFTSGRSAGGFQFLTWASCSRCALVAGGSQTGSTLQIDGLPASTTGLARAGDLIEVNGELKRLVADIDSDGSGGALAMFEPSLRTAPADNLPMILRAPMGRFLLEEEASGWGSRPGVLSDFTLNLVEDVT
ncbi:MAG: hypothetical protein RIS35_1884 [Pseudomonadota bacterium]|jgi:hypothetical protein